MYSYNAATIVRISVLLTAVLLAPGLARASEAFDWPALGEAFTAFVAEPTAARADAVVALLPSGYRPGYPPDEEDQKIRLDLELGTEAVQLLVERGSLPALRVATALGALSDGDWSEWLGYIRGTGAVFHPREYLEGVAQGLATDMPHCSIAVLFVHWELEGDPRPVLEARLRALESVDVPELAAAKACSLRILRTELAN